MCEIRPERVIDIHHASKPLIYVYLPVTHLHFCSFIVMWWMWHANTWAKLKYCGMGSTWHCGFFFASLAFIYFPSGFHFLHFSSKWSWLRIEISFRLKSFTFKYYFQQSISDRPDRFCRCLAARPSFIIPCLILRFLGVCRNLPDLLSNSLLIPLPRQRKNGGRRAGQDGHRRSKDRPLEAFHHSSDQRFLLRNQRRAVLHIPLWQGEDTRNGYGSRHTCGQGVPG